METSRPLRRAVAGGSHRLHAAFVGSQFGELTAFLNTTDTEHDDTAGESAARTKNEEGAQVIADIRVSNCSVHDFDDETKSMTLEPGRNVNAKTAQPGHQSVLHLD